MQTRVDRLVHDVRGALNSISMNAELARMLTQQQGSPEKIQHCLGVILRECNQCNMLMEGFRADLKNGLGTESSSSA